MFGRRDFVKVVGGLGASLLTSGQSRAADEGTAGVPNPGKKPNFVVIVADDQCFRTIDALNNKEVRTPNFDRLVRGGTTFTHCFHQGSWTGAICVASRAMMHTGRYVWNCGGNNCGHYPLLGEALRMGGYKTAVVGKWHNGDETALRSFAVGKSIGPGFFASTPEKGLAYDRPRSGDPWTPWDPKYRGQWTPNDLWDMEKAEHDAVWISQNGPPPIKASPRYQRDRHSCELYADTAVDLLRQLAAEPAQPFFLYVAWNAPHDPRQAPKELVDSYPPEKIEVPPNFLPQHPFDQGDFHVRDEEIAPFPRTPHDVQVHRREYYALITYMDQQLGRILDAIDATEQAANTCVVVTADHGLAVGEHGLMGKQNLYDCSVRIPFIMTGPGIAAGRQIDELVYQHSLFPTMCDLAGIAIPATVEFPSLVPLLQGSQRQLYDSVYCAYRRYQRMVRTGRYKLILYPEINKAQLFDLQQDPWEMNDLSAAAGQAETITVLFRRLLKWQRTVNDTLKLDPLAFGIRG